MFGDDLDLMRSLEEKMLKRDSYLSASAFDGPWKKS